MIPRASRWKVTVTLAVGVTALVLVLTTCGVWPGGKSAPSGGDGSHATALGWGFTHTQYSADQGGAKARDTVDKVLAAQPMPQNQAIMGWGAGNPEPSPGRYDFDDLDRRVALMRATGGTPVLTLCCAPDWMKGGKAGRTNWSQGSLETAPSPEHYKDFAALVGKIAERYPDVRHFIVWNELKGFYDDAEQSWDAKGYTDLYNLVYRELKKRDPANLVGGPYVVADSERPGDSMASDEVHGAWGGLDQRSVDAITYWNQHKAGADFVVVDGASYTREDHELIPDPFAATDKFTDVTRWLTGLTHLPVWWAEWYVEPPGPDDERDGWSEPRRTAVQAAGMIALAKGGTDTALYWNPETTGASCPGCLWRSTKLSGGGTMLPMMALLSRFGHEFPPGARFRTVRVADDDKPNVRVLADDGAVLVVNIRDRPIQARVDGATFDMKPYAVHWLTR